MSDRHIRNGIFKNNHEQYSKIFEKKDVKSITQYSTPTFQRPSPADLQDLTIIDYAWQRGDRFYKIAANVYGDMKLWWVIPWFNQKPLEADYEFGEIIHIPMPIDLVLSMV